MSYAIDDEAEAELRKLAEGAGPSKEGRVWQRLAWATLTLLDERSQYLEHYGAVIKKYRQALEQIQGRPGSDCDGSCRGIALGATTVVMSDWGPPKERP